MCFGVYQSNAQIGLARYATFAYLCDVYILESQRGLRLGKWLMQTVFEHPDLRGVRRRFMPATRDAHSLYAQYGFKPLEHPERFMSALTRARTVSSVFVAVNLARVIALDIADKARDDGAFCVTAR